MNENPVKPVRINSESCHRVEKTFWQSHSQSEMPVSGEGCLVGDVDIGCLFWPQSGGQICPK